MRNTVQTKFRSAVAPLIAGLLLFLAFASGAIAADSYKLGISDKISVRVVEWQAAGSTFLDWTAVSGDYLVGPDGAISFPFVGQVPAAGQTVGDLSKILGSGLRTTLGLTDPPNVTVEVSTFGPIYVTGDVQTPGAYPFAPGLNVIKLVSIAGGLRRAADPAARSDRDLISLQGDYDVLHDQYVRLLIHRARLDAVLTKQESIAVPAEIQDGAGTPALVAVETAVMKAGAQQLTSEVSALDAQKQLLTSGIDTLTQKRQSTSDQLASAQQRLQKVQGLADNGLAIADRVAALQGNVADLEGRLLDIDAAELKAKQDVNDADNQSAKLVSDQFIEASNDRQQSDMQLAEVELKMATQERLIREAIAFGGAAHDDQAAAPSYTYSILRDGAKITATDTDGVQPGDVVSATVTLPPPDSP